jgi:hypothetical protein
VDEGREVRILLMNDSIEMARGVCRRPGKTRPGPLSGLLSTLRKRCVNSL